jgi:hypothetical protein
VLVEAPKLRRRVCLRASQQAFQDAQVEPDRPNPRDVRRGCAELGRTGAADHGLLAAAGAVVGAVAAAGLGGRTPPVEHALLHLQKGDEEEGREGVVSRQAKLAGGGDDRQPTHATVNHIVYCSHTQIKTHARAHARTHYCHTTRTRTRTRTRTHYWRTRTHAHALLVTVTDAAAPVAAQVAGCRRAPAPRAAPLSSAQHTPCGDDQRIHAARGARAEQSRPPTRAERECV